MGEVIYLPKGSRPRKEPNSIAIFVISSGSGSIKSATNNKQSEFRLLKHDAKNMIDKFSSGDSAQKIYVIGYDEAKDHAINLDQLRSYVERSINK